jgi:putative photosynthetic complex assembly protein
MSDQSPPAADPRIPVLGAAALVVFAIVSVLAVNLFGSVEPRPPEGLVVETRALNFVDGSDGSVIVRDADSGRTVRVLDPGTNGFVRGMLRGLARERRIAGAGEDAPFELLKLEDGQLRLADPATGHQIALRAFGETNAGVFADLLRSDDLYAQNSGGNE